MARAVLIDEVEATENEGDVVQEVTQEQPVEEQIEEQMAQEPEPEPESDVPERYKGKSLQEIIAMHEEAQKLIGRQANEVGEYRRLIDEQLRANAKTQPKEDESSSELDFFEDPDKAVSRAIEKHPIVQDAKRYSEQYRRSTAQAELSRNHPDMNEILQDPAFGQWIQSSPVRVKLFQQADQGYDLDAANELFTNWKERKGAVAQTVEAEKKARKAEVQKASTGAGRGSVEGAGKKIYRRADLMELMIKNPDRYEALQPEIMQAYAEKRVR